LFIQTQSEKSLFGWSGAAIRLGGWERPENLYEILMPRRRNRDRNLTPVRGYQGGKGAIMLDLAFVVLGFAVIALMGFYAMALRQL
jgi:hypothetical protein